MRKGFILKVIESELNKAGHQNTALAEIQLRAIVPSRNKDRLAYCILGNHTHDELNNVIRESLKDHFEITINQFPNIKIAQENHLDTMNDPVMIENNWRGRLFAFDHISPLQDNMEEIKNFMLRSVWRLIIQKDTMNNFYVRHDIFPFFWSAGHSTGGRSESEYIESVKNQFWHIAEPKFHRQDYDFDVIKVFGKKANGTSTFPSIPFCELGEDTSDPRNHEVTFDMPHPMKEEKLNHLIKQINSFFTSI